MNRHMHRCISVAVVGLWLPFIVERQLTDDRLSQEQPFKEPQPMPAVTDPSNSSSTGAGQT